MGTFRFHRTRHLTNNSFAFTIKIPIKQENDARQALHRFLGIAVKPSNFVDKNSTLP